MNKFKIAFANMRKRKGASITFLVMVLISALMLSISLSLMIGVSSFYDKKAEELNAPHFTDYVYIDSYEKYEGKINELIDSNTGITDVYVLDTILAITDWKLESSTLTKTTYFISESELYGQSFFKPGIIDKQTSKTFDMIILPLGFKLNGITAGEKITFELAEKKYTFTVYGFYEDPVCGSSTSNLSTVYISDGNYNELGNEVNSKNEPVFSNWKNLMIRFENSDMVNAFRSDFTKITNFSANEEIYFSYSESKTGASTFIQMLAMILIIFAVIILIVAFIVVNFSIKNSISEDIAQIGALKSIGYKSRVLRSSQLIQYLLISIIGTILGVIVFIFVFGLLGNILASTSGLLWVENNFIIPIIITVVLILGLTLLFTLLATRKYKKITPINALRQGESHHSFKRNPMPLEKHNMPLNLHLGFKRFFNSIKNSVTLCVVVALLTFISLVTYIVSYNLSNDTTAMTQMIGLEQAEIWIQTNPANDIGEINNIVKSYEKVDYTLLNGTANCYVNNFSTTVRIFEDNTKLKTNTLIRGSLPKNNTQIALGTVIAKDIGKDLGEVVTLEIKGVEFQYYISGITQSIQDSGEGCEILPGAMLNHNEDFKADTIYVYLKDGVDIKAFDNELKSVLGGSAVTLIYDDAINPMLSSLGDPLSMVSILMIIITVIIITFVLFLIVSALIRKQKKEFGIMKAMGYKNRRIVLQLLISFLPSLLIGTIIGIILGFLVTNPILSILFVSIGIAKVYFIIPTALTLIIGLSIFVVSMIISYLISLRLRKISPIKLIVGD